MTSPGWVERYQRGEREQVWHELRLHRQRVRQPDLVEDAGAVCDAMARRARHNINVVIERLDEQGYRFHTNDDAQDAVIPHFSPAGR